MEGLKNEEAKAVFYAGFGILLISILFLLTNWNKSIYFLFGAIIMLGGYFMDWVESKYNLVTFVNYYIKNGKQ